MNDETNELLRQILDVQRQNLSLIQKEMERTSEFRIVAVEMQKAVQRRAVIVAIVVSIGIGLILIGVMSTKP